MKNIAFFLATVCALLSATASTLAQGEDKSTSLPGRDAAQVIKDGTWLCKDKPLPPGYEIVKEVDDESCHTGRANVIRRSGAPPAASTPSGRPEKSAVADSSAEQDETYKSARPIEIIDLAADQKSNVSKYLKITGQLTVGSNYDHGYRRAEETHLAFTLKDLTGQAFVYIRRGRVGEGVQEQILQSKNNVLSGTFVIRLNPDRFETSADVYADLIRVEPAEK